MSPSTSTWLILPSLPVLELRRWAVSAARKFFLRCALSMACTSSDAILWRSRHLMTMARSHHYLQRISFTNCSASSNQVTTLARQLRVVDYFTLGWGTMVGVGWLVVMDDWLLRGGVLGGVVGFAIGGALLLPIGYVYGQLVSAMPDASGEVAYTAQVFPRGVSYATGWMMLLAYFIVCPWEAVAVGRIAAYIFPALDSMELYHVGGRPVFLPRLIIGLALTGLLTLLNYRGIRLSATFQNWTAFGTLALFAIFVAVGVSKGSPGNFPPLFSHGPFLSIFLVMQIVPYFMTGFESVTKAAEEANPEFRSQTFLVAIWMAIIVG